MKLFVAIAFMAISSSSFAQKACEKALQKQVADQIKVARVNLNLLMIKHNIDQERHRQQMKTQKAIMDAIMTQGIAKQIENYKKSAEKAAKANDEALKAKEKVIRKAEEMRLKAANKAEQAKADADNMKLKHDNAQQTAAENKAKVNEIRESLKKLLLSAKP